MQGVGSFESSSASGLTITISILNYIHNLGNALFTTSAQSVSISGRVGRLRLANNFSTRVILASAGSDTASSNTFLATEGIFVCSVCIYSSAFSHNNQFFVGAGRPQSAAAINLLPAGPARQTAGQEALVVICTVKAFPGDCEIRVVLYFFDAFAA